MLKRFNQRIHEPSGFAKPLPARERVWKTDTSKANFKLPKALHASFDAGTDNKVLRLVTLRSNDQFNTIVYGYRDRFRGIEGTRIVVLVNEHDMERFDLSEGDVVGLESVADDGVQRRMSGFKVVRYSIPPGCLGAYYPEANALIPLYQHAERSHVPAAKSVPVRFLRDPTQP